MALPNDETGAAVEVKEGAAVEVDPPNEKTGAAVGMAPADEKAGADVEVALPHDETENK